MATIETLHRSISSMSDGELFPFIQEMRNRRRVPKKVKKATATKMATNKKRAQPKELDLFAQAANMSNGQKADLLKALQGMVK